MKLMFEKSTNHDGTGWMLYSPNINLYWNEGVYCLSFNIIFWSVQLWWGTPEEIK
jgi:hypothetical protein